MYFFCGFKHPKPSPTQFEYIQEKADNYMDHTSKT